MKEPKTESPPVDPDPMIEAYDWVFVVMEADDVAPLVRVMPNGLKVSHYAAGDIERFCKGNDVVVISPHQGRNKKGAQLAAEHLRTLATRLVLYKVPGFGMKHSPDLETVDREWTEDGVGGIERIFRGTPPWLQAEFEPPPPPEPFPAHGKRSVAPGPESDIGEDVKDPVGEVDPIAFYGPLGKLALETQRETEANPLFVLLHLMAFFGTACDRTPHFVVSASKHYLNLFIGLIGVSGFGRKGTASHVAKEIWRKVNPTFTMENISDGLNSGAGLLYHLRDETEKTKSSPADEGVSDKRHVFLESELSSVLMQGHRENDPLLGHLRKFFDGENVVRSNTKDPTKVSEGHVTIAGHCTPMDLEIHLSDLDKANGTANRFLWIYGVRSKLLSRGGDVFSLLKDLELPIQAVVFALEDAKKVGRIRRSEDVEERWDELYREFNEIPPGRLGAFFVRAPTIVLRMAAIFTLADRETVIRMPHLEAALAIWKHSARSLRWIFRGDTDFRSEKLLDALKEKPHGLTKRQIIHDVFGRNLEAESIDELLLRLLAHQAIVREETKPGPKGGRPGTKYRIKVW